MWTTASFKVPIEEFNALKASAEAEGLTLSQFVRKKVLGGEKNGN